MGEDSKYGHYRDSRVRDGQQTRGVEGSGQFFFADNPILGQLEQGAKAEGLQFIDELIFENGAVYKGKSTHFFLAVFANHKFTYSDEEKWAY